MKARHGFVSNSSTTSFCIYGTKIDSDTLNNGKEGSGFYHLVDQANKLGYTLEIHSGNSDGSNAKYIGRSWSMIGDDETGRQFKEYIEKAVTELLTGLDIKFDSNFTTYEEAYYDG